MSCFRSKTKDDDGGSRTATKEKSRMREADMEKKLKALSTQRKEHVMTHKIPVVGAGGSGKSTLMKQMQILYLNGFDDSSRREKVPDIRRNIRDGMMSITGAMPDLKPPVALEHPEYQKYVDYVRNIATAKDFDYPPEFFDYCGKLWMDTGVQEAFSRANEYQLMDSAGFFLDRCEKVGRPEYLPDEQDILRCRDLAFDTREVTCTLNKVRHHMYDVGSQQREPHEWNQAFYDITAVIFVCDCSSYGCQPHEDPLARTQNRLTESLELFESIWNNPLLSQNSIILLLNKQDILQEKILKGRTRLEDHFEVFSSYPQPPPDPHYPGEAPQLTRARSFIRDQFVAIARSNGYRRCYPHYTTAVDGGNIVQVLGNIETILQRVYMGQLGLL